METDRELLEKAAKAAGIHALRDPYGVLRNYTGCDPAMNIFAAPAWNPLTDDGDALRLAVQLGLGIDHGATRSWSWRSWGDRLAATCEERHNGDSVAATRRAIVRAAAAMAAPAETRRWPFPMSKERDE